MKINNDHMYHGAALTQIAEHEQFTSINGVRIGGELSRSAFRVNETIGVFVKYGTEPKPPDNDYIFTFTAHNKVEFQSLNRRCDDVYLAMVCVEDRHICCISYAEFSEWINRRRRALGHAEDTSTILVGIPRGKAFRVNMNMPRRRRIYLAKPQLVPRNRFPNVLFE